MPKEKLFGTAAHLGVINAPAPCRVGQIHPASFALTGAHPARDGRPAEGRSTLQNKAFLREVEQCVRLMQTLCCHS